MAEPLLDLDTLTRRPTVRIDGQPYDLRTLDDFSLVEGHRHWRESERLSDLVHRVATLTADEESDAEQLIEAYCRRMVVAPPTVLDRLTPGQRVQIVATFALLPRTRRPTTGAPLGPVDTGGTRQSTGASTSPASHGSMAVAP